MKTLFLITLLCLSVAITYGQKPSGKDFEKLKWLNGSWKQTNVKPGEKATETWTVASPDKMTGKGITTKGKDTVFVEKLSLLIKGDEIYYVAEVTGSTKLTYFKLTSITPDSFVCENPAHDFPKKIAYQLAGSHIKAVISGNGKSVDYLFDKVTK